MSAFDLITIWEPHSRLVIVPSYCNKCLCGEAHVFPQYKGNSSILWTTQLIMAFCMFIQTNPQARRMHDASINYNRAWRIFKAQSRVNRVWKLKRLCPVAVCSSVFMLTSMCSCCKPKNESQANISQTMFFFGAFICVSFSMADGKNECMLLGKEMSNEIFFLFLNLFFILIKNFITISCVFFLLQVAHRYSSLHLHMHNHSHSPIRVRTLTSHQTQWLFNDLQSLISWN